jgi:hypothetical protein
MITCKSKLKKESMRKKRKIRSLSLRKGRNQRKHRIKI